MISVDHNDYSIVYSCSLYYGGMLGLEYLWILSRNPYLIGSDDSNAFKSKVFNAIQEIIPHFDIKTINLSTHTAEAGCKYLPLPEGSDFPNPNDSSQALPAGTVDDFPDTDIPRPDL